LRIKEQEKRLTLNKHDDDDDFIRVKSISCCYANLILHMMKGMTPVGIERMGYARF
jgi:hypothetical protein